jgi:hypothetical protein
VVVPAAGGLTEVASRSSGGGRVAGLGGGADGRHHGSAGASGRLDSS